MPEVRVRRVYEEPAPEDGMRVLVDRIWPRGVRKDAARLDEWARDLAPSTELRTWYGHDPAKFGEFRRRYQAELAQPGPAAALARLRDRASTGPVTLLTATRDVAHSQAAVLAGELQSGPGEQADPDPEAGGEPACYAHLVCPECGSVTTEGHRPGCSMDPAAAGTERG
jgi:uncharacterized protein YeaO (DUF488 family)